MQRNFLGLFSTVALFFLVINWSCTKIDSTTLGADLIPAVDNVSTFETILPVNGTQGIFNDTTRLSRSEYHLLGSITNDPLFGQTKADIYLELKPSFFPYYFGNANDTIDNSKAPGTGFDSAVLCLSVNGYYGDTTQPQHISVYQVSNSITNFRNDSTYMINYQPDAPNGFLLGQATVVPSDLKNLLYLNNKTDSVSYQIRIKLSNSFLSGLVANRDTSVAGNGIYVSDSLFKEIYKGFAVLSDHSPGSNGLFYSSLTDAKTRLEVHYRRKNNNKIDTTYSSFYFSTGLLSSVSASAHANSIKRDRVTGNPEYPNNVQADALYIQSVPGTFATLRIPGLDTMQNSIIHRAELIMEQVPADPATDAALPAPLFLYLDLKDTGSSGNYKPVYYDLNPSVSYYPDNSSLYYPTSGIDLNYFGGFRRMKTDNFGNQIAYYNFNLSRYVQNMITRKGVNYDIRLYAPYNLTYYNVLFAYPNSTQTLANGRIKIGNGNNANYKLRMRIIYSKI